VADLAGEALRPAVEPPIDHDATPDAGAERRVQQVARALSCAEAEFPQRGRAGVVLDVHGDAQLLLDRRRQHEVAKAGHVRRQEHHAVVRVDEPRHAERGRDRPSRGPGGDVAEELQDLLQDDVRAHGGGRAAVETVDEVAFFVHQGGAQVRAAEIGCDNQARH
jgi:hypothetical protein